MCLDTVNPELEPCTEGYKVFVLDKRSNRLSSQYRGEYSCKHRKQWLNAADYCCSEKGVLSIILSDSGHAYSAGWHIFYTRDAAERYKDYAENVVALVKVREPLTTGYQFVPSNPPGNGKPEPITVSRYIKIEEVYV